MRCKLTRVEVNGALGNNPPRTEQIVGEFEIMPTVGSSFHVINDKPLNGRSDHGFSRHWITSPVKAIQENLLESKVIVFATENSVYRLEIE